MNICVSVHQHVTTRVFMSVCLTCACLMSAYGTEGVCVHGCACVYRCACGLYQCDCVHTYLCVCMLEVCACSYHK